LIGGAQNACRPFNERVTGGQNMLRQATLALVVLPLISLAAHAELAVSAQDGKQVLVDGVPTVPDSPVAD
jgi:hypothetical protein